MIPKNLDWSQNLLQQNPPHALEDAPLFPGECDPEFAQWLATQLAEMLLLLDQDHTPESANAAFFTCSGYEPYDLPQLRLCHLFPAATAQAMRLAFATGARETFEIDLISKLGRSIPVELRTATYQDSDGRPRYLVLANPSKQHEMLQHMREARKQLVHSSRLASLGEMTAGIGHELTQPLNAILLFARNCRKALDNPTENLPLLRENIDSILDRVNRASAIINTMRSFARKTEEDLIPLEVNAVLRKVLGFLEPQLRLHEIEMDIRLTETPCVTPGVEVSLEQIFLNLMQNALQAMGHVPAPKLTLTSTTTERLDVKTMRKRPYVVVTVTDNGEGIAEDLQKKIFDPFFTTRSVGVGTGLGLSIVDRIICGFSGHIEVLSAVGKGSSFLVYLPLHPKAADH